MKLIIFIFNALQINASLTIFWRSMAMFFIIKSRDNAMVAWLVSCNLFNRLIMIKST